MSGVPVTHTDSAEYSITSAGIVPGHPLMVGTHKGAAGASVLSDPGADFKSCGVDPVDDTDFGTIAQLVMNETDGSEGVVTAVTEDTVTCTLSDGGTWDNGDVYIILKTGVEDAVISTHWTDRRFGQKVVNPAQLDEDGVFPEDADIDEEDEEIFGPGQPERNYRG